MPAEAIDPVPVGAPVAAARPSATALPRHGPHPGATPRRKTLYRALALALICLPAFGCQSAMSTPGSAGSSRIIPNEFPLRFKEHNFEAHCYNATGCSVLYHDSYHVRKEPDEASPPPKVAEYKKYWSGASYLAIPNFPSPAIVKWRSLDGVAHEEEVDIGEIFKDELILHKVPQGEIPVQTAATPGDPDIFLEVNDRTINVYMQATIFLKDTATRKGDFRDDLILAWSRTY